MRYEATVGMSRRDFLAAMAAGAAAVSGASLLEACATGSSSGVGGTNTLSQLAGVLPDYVPVGLVKPDLPGVNGSAAAFLKWPTSPVRAIKSPPATGSVTAMTPAWWAIPPSQNAYYDAVNKRLGANVTFSIVNGNDYGTKIDAVLAGKQLPDITVIPSWNWPPGFTEATVALFADLSDHLKGSKVRKFPFLANLPTGAWGYGAFNNRLYGIPFPNSLFGVIPFYRKDIFDQLGVAPPKTADELYNLCKTVTKPSANRWAVGDIFQEVKRIFGVPQDWRIESSGKLTYYIETSEFEAAVAFMTRLYHDGFVHPTIVAGQTSQEKDLFESGRLLIYKDGTGAWHEALERNRPSNPSFDMQGWAPFSHDGKAKPFYPINTPGGIYSFINKNLSSDRIEELLGIANWCAATLGTEEYTLMTFGVQGVHWTPGPGGVPQPTDQGKREVTFTYGFLAGRPDEISEPQYPDYVKDMHAWQANAAKYVVKSPVYGLNIEEPSDISAFKPKEPGNAQALPIDNKVSDIFHGRAPVSDLEAAVKDWARNGGDRYRAFYASILTKK